MKKMWVKTVIKVKEEKTSTVGAGCWQSGGQEENGDSC